MLSDEEKKAIEHLKNYPINWLIENVNESAIKIVLNLIEKQSKEIEHQKEKRENQKQELAILNEKQKEFNKLMNTVNSYKGQFKRQQKEIDELNRENTRQHELIGNIHQKWKDKIKAKIEELDDLNSPFAQRVIEGKEVYLTEMVQNILQSLLEKE